MAEKARLVVQARVVVPEAVVLVPVVLLVVAVVEPQLATLHRSGIANRTSHRREQPEDALIE
jgi:hypothetical protein